MYSHELVIVLSRLVWLRFSFLVGILLTYNYSHMCTYMNYSSLRIFTNLRMHINFASLKNHCPERYIQKALNWIYSWKIKFMLINLLQSHTNFNFISCLLFAISLLAHSIRAALSSNILHVKATKRELASIEFDTRETTLNAAKFRFANFRSVLPLCMSPIINFY